MVHDALLFAFVADAREGRGSLHLSDVCDIDDRLGECGWRATVSMAAKALRISSVVTMALA
jgi:hypothetical protein